MRNIKMAARKNHRSEAVPVSNYSAAIARAVEWLGDRYLLAKPIKAAPGRVAPGTTPANIVIRTVRSRVSPDKKILRHLQDSKYQDDADNHCEQDEDMHSGYIASWPLTDNTRIQANADDSGRDRARWGASREPAVSPAALRFPVNS